MKHGLRNLNSILVITLLFTSLFFISGCLAKIKVKRTNLITNMVTEASYTRWGNQSIGSFELDLNGTVKFTSQESDTQIAFRLGVLSTTIGKGK